MFKVLLGFVLALALAFVIRVVYDMGKRSVYRNINRMANIATTMIVKEEEALKNKKPVRKKK